jgi:hypothetical protein
VRIVPLSDELNDSYREFLTGCDSSLIYHTLEYRDFLHQLAGGTSEYLLAVDRGDRTRGALPLFRKTGRYGTILNSLPFFGSIGGIVGADAQARQQLLAHYTNLLAQADIAASTVIENPLDVRDNSDIPHDLTDYRIGQVTPLGEEGAPAVRLMDIFHQKTRNMIRKAEKSGVTVDVDETAYDFLQEIHKENIGALGGLVKPPAFFDLVQKQFSPGSMRRLYVARYGGEMVAASLMLYFNKTVEYFVPVIRSDRRHLQPLSLIIYRAMIDAANEGYRFWNWGGTWQSQEGVYRFKSRWGTQDRNYTYYIRVKGSDILRLSKEEILREYPWYFVVPFSALRSVTPRTEVQTRASS